MTTYTHERSLLKDCYEAFNVNSYQKQMHKAMRAMRGFPSYQLTVNCGEDEAQFLARYAGLTSDEDTADETKLSAALAKLLWNCMAIREEFLSEFADGDLSDKDKLNEFYARAALKVLKS